MKVKLPDCNKCAHKEVCMHCKNVVPVKNSLEYTTKLMESEHFNFIVDCPSYEELKAVIR